MPFIAEDTPARALSRIAASYGEACLEAVRGTWRLGGLDLTSAEAVTHLADQDRIELDSRIAEFEARRAWRFADALIRLRESDTEST